jgi:putative lipoprotein
MKAYKGKIILPANAPSWRAHKIVIEVRDVSLADAPSILIASEKLHDIMLEPGKKINFEIRVPEVNPKQSLAFRVHISKEGDDRVRPGDLITTINYPLPPDTRTIIELAVVVI